MIRVNEKRTAIGLPNTPSNWVGKPKTTKVSVITISCGGGMGGSKWNVYAKRLEYDKFMNGGMVEIEELTKGKLLINTNNIVVVDNTHSVITQEHHSENPSYKGNTTYMFLVKDGQKITFDNTFDNNAFNSNNFC